MAQGLIQAGCRAKTPKSPNIKETEGESAPVPALALVYAVWYDCHGRSPPPSAGVPAAADIAAVSDEVGVRGGRVSEREMEQLPGSLRARAWAGRTRWVCRRCYAPGNSVAKLTECPFTALFSW